MRRNLGTILIGLGAFLVAFAPLLKFFVAPAVVAAPKDFWQVETLRDDKASYFDTALLKTVQGAPVAMVTTVRGDPRAAKKESIAVWDLFTVLKREGANNNLLMQSIRYGLDRRTGGLSSCCGASIDGDTSVKPSGLGVIWPVAAVEKKTYLYFDPITRQAWPIAYQGIEPVRGIQAFRFQQTVPEMRVAAMDPIPGRYLGLDNKKKDVSFPVDKYYSITRTVWVDPRTGVPVSERDQIHMAARTRDGAGRLDLIDLDLHTTTDSQKQLVSLADDTAFKFSAVRGWGPVILLAAGLIALIGGAAVQYLLPAPGPERRPRRGSRASGRGVKPVLDGGLVDGKDPAGALPGFRPGPPPAPPRN